MFNRLVAKFLRHTGVNEMIYFDVRNYGAKVDGVTNDLPSIMSCLAKHGRAFIPRGTCAVSGSIALLAGETLQGVSHGQSVIKALDASEPAIRVYNSYACVRDLAVWGCEQGGVGINIDGAEYCRFDNLHINMFRYGQGGTGVLMTTDTKKICTRNTFTHVSVDNTTVAVALEDTAPAENNCIVGYNHFSGLFIGMEQVGIELRAGNSNGASYNTFDHLMIQGSGTAKRGVMCDAIGNVWNHPVIDGPDPAERFYFGPSSQSNSIVNPLGVAADNSGLTNDQVSGGANTVVHVHTGVGERI